MLRFIKFLLILFLVFPIFAQGQAPQRTIIISDIDDTIQLTNLRPYDGTWSAQASHYWRLFLGLFKNHDAFVGMPALYMSLAINGNQIKYVSGAPSLISRLPEKFLQTTGFPVGSLDVRPNSKISTEDFKVSKISEIILKNPYAQFILIGDNGEQDVASYARLTSDSRFKTRIIATFIHRLYPEGIGLSLAAGQRPYFTVADLAVQFYLNGYISSRQTAEILKLVNTGFASRFDAIQNRAFPTYGKLQSSDLQYLTALKANLQETELHNLFQCIIENLQARLKESTVLICSESTLITP